MLNVWRIQSRHRNSAIQCPQDLLWHLWALWAMLVLFMAGLARWRHLTNCDHNNLVMLNCESPVSRALSMLNPATNAAKSKTKAYRCQWTAALTWRTRHVFKPLKHVLNSPLYHAFQHISTIVYLNHLWTWRSFVQRSFRQFEGITSDEPHVDVEFFHHAHNLILHSRFPHPNLRRNSRERMNGDHWLISAFI